MRITYFDSWVCFKWVGVMAFEATGERSLDYYPCRYGTSRLIFRGPRKDLTDPYFVTLGGTETYGKFLPSPYPALLERRSGCRVVNLGCVNGGLDAYIKDPGVMQIASESDVAIVQIIGAHNLSNRYYTVHPRRNDRFIGATPLLRSIFREVDFTEFNFTRHMLLFLQKTCVDRFEVLAEELRATWVMKMRSLLSALPRHRILIWICDVGPPRRGARLSLDKAPPFVDREMVEAVQSDATSYIECIASMTARSQDVSGMAFGPMEYAAAASLPGPAVHHMAAERLHAEVNLMLGQ